MSLSAVQKLSKFFSSKEKFEQMKNESQQWRFMCNSCNALSSVWDAGSIRQSSKKSSYKTLKCPKCGTIGKRKLEKKTDAVQMQ